MKWLNPATLLAALAGAALAVAAPKYAAVITSTSGASANAAVKSGKKYFVQCDAPVRFRCGTGSGTAASNSTGSSFGVKLDQDQLFAFTTSTTDDYCAAIPTSGSATTTCPLFEDLP